MDRPVWERPDWGHMDEDPSYTPPVRHEQREASGSISVAELRNPLKGKSLHTIQHAVKDLHDGKTSRALANLRKALEDPAAKPYALTILGTEHLKMGLVDEAVPELEEAVRLLPGNAAAHNNLGFGLRLKGENERALEEVKKALQLDPSSPTIRYLIGALLLEQGQEEEGVYHLKQAADKVVSARRLLADYYAVRGNVVEAARYRQPAIPAGAAAFQAAQ